MDTATVIATRLGVDLNFDDRLRERMNWGGPDLQGFDDFLVEWKRTTNDRSYLPPLGDSSQAAGERFRKFLAEVADRYSTGLVVAVSHGGVTVDCLRDLVGDVVLKQLAPEILDTAVPNGGMTRLQQDDNGWEVLTIGDTEHLLRTLQAGTLSRVHPAGRPIVVPIHFECSQLQP